MKDPFKVVFFVETEGMSLQLGCVWRGFKLPMKEFVPYT